LSLKALLQTFAASVAINAGAVQVACGSSSKRERSTRARDRQPSQNRQQAMPRDGRHERRLYGFEPQNVSRCWAFGDKFHCDRRDRVEQIGWEKVA
jgi:hypothetical protein